MIALVLGVIAASILRRVDALGLRVAIHQDRRRAGDPDGFGGGEKRVGVGDALVARADAQRHQRQPDRVGAVADADGVFGAAVGGELAFEPFEHRPQDKLAALDDLLKIGVNLGFDVVVLPNVTVKIDFHHSTLRKAAPALQGISKSSRPPSRNDDAAGDDGGTTARGRRKDTRR